MIKIITGVLSWILDPLFACLNLLPAPPAELTSSLQMVIGYMADGLGIFNFFCPVSAIMPAITIYLSVFSVKHGYDMILWILKKIPFVGVE